MIKAEKIKGFDDSDWLKVSFKKNKEYTEKMGTIPGASYSPVRECWAVPYSQLDKFNSLMAEHLIVWDNEEPNGGGISEDTIPSYPTTPGYSIKYDLTGKIINSTGFKTTPWGEYQVKGHNLLVEKDFLILADEQGLGKSWQVATAMEAKKKLGKVKRGVIVAKASLVYNWRDEIHMHTNEKAVVLTGNVKQRSKMFSELTYSDDWTFIIVSYETFRDTYPCFQHLDTKKSLDFIVLDEAHKIKNPMSKMGDSIHKIPFKCKYILTATPLPNSPLEAYNYLKLGKQVDMHWFEFQQRYAILGGYGGKEVIGYQNILELKTNIQRNMLRRRKIDKLKELPEVTFRTIKIEMTPGQKKLYNAVKREILEDLTDTSLEQIPSSLAKLMRLQQITNTPALIGGKDDSAKLKALDDLLEDLIEGGEKVIVFSRFKSLIHLLEERYAHYNPAIIHGDVDAQGKTITSAVRELKREYGTKWSRLTQKEREKLVEDRTTSERQLQVYKFQKDDSSKIFLGTSTACREGLTLTKATHVVFTDLEWSYAYVEQAFSRAHRIGQRNAVTVHYLQCVDTIDEHVKATVDRKESMAQNLLDNGVEVVGLVTAKQLIKELIGKQVKETKVTA